ncbi:MAG: hypothetical protein A3C04_00200 [Candidatus Wildermuthbacteria bacterium RIFCSPHIGHO2_02_FULL_45_25]|uniref:ASCH domain-containing protein n=2 Tax=Bacteria candidate phyla TaxID=1783234 RepID=A0A1G2QZ54_9BACT|nr:MAG: hypothetical protein A2720_00520 [Candidatus Doudnabacteria bacterium RIFCSPHIGHO2_01_FULL_46_24]OHA65905.1 MAG: hypothetical protein A3C04_00200 [Candidatus Wildermuthbacteria bacterium RIFCSPHIGHO2_02_FULL_45_25]
MVIHQMRLSANPFEKVAAGVKIIESRLFDEKRRKINIDDQIEFTCIDNPSRKIIANVEALYRYSNFENLFSDFPSGYFGSSSKEVLLMEIEKIYSKEEQEKYGVIGIKLSLVK